MKSTTYCMIAVLCLICCQFVQPGHAEETAGEMGASPMLGMYVFDKDQNIDKGLLTRAGLSYNFTDNWGGEFGLGYGRFDHEYFDTDACGCKTETIGALVGQIDALYHFRPDQPLVPYLAAGLGGVVLNGGHQTDNYMTLNYGGGLKYFLNENMAIRADVRHLAGLSESWNNALFTIGLTFHFGGEKPMTASDPSSVVGIDELSEMPASGVITIDMKVQFDLDKADIKPEFHDKLKKLADFMKANPDTRADIEGHTCTLGTPSYNMDLSRRRAVNVKNYLVQTLGIAAHRLRTFGYGQTRPIADNNTQEGRIKNRRVYVVVIGPER